MIRSMAKGNAKSPVLRLISKETSGGSSPCSYRTCWYLRKLLEKKDGGYDRVGQKTLQRSRSAS